MCSSLRVKRLSDGDRKSAAKTWRWGKAIPRGSYRTQGRDVAHHGLGCDSPTERHRT
jgi:hypothetical protein